MTKTLGLAALAVVAAGCFVGHREEQVITTTESQNLTGFSRVSANGSFDLTITIGDEEPIKIEGDKDRVKNLETSVVDGELVLREKSSGLFGSHGPLHVTISVPSLTALEINGSGDAKIDGVSGDRFAIEINGSGNADVSGSTDDCKLSINGSGDIGAKGLNAKTASVSIAGSGDVELSVVDELSVSVAGSGDVTYFGDPKVTSSISGSGDVSKG